MRLVRPLRHLLAGFGLTAAALANAQPLTLETYNPGASAVFPVSSNLILGERDAILVDAQFSSNEADALIERVRASGRNLKIIFISHGDPDFYFGLERLTSAFPEARVLTSEATLAHIEATVERKLDYWGPILGDGAPTQVPLPEVLDGDRMLLEGQEIRLIGLGGPYPGHSSLWIPALGAVVGGVLTSANIHLWTADAQKPEDRRAWLAALDQLEALRPKILVPGHYLGEPHRDLRTLEFTREYLLTLERELARTNDAEALVAAMQAHYPQLGDSDGLSLSAKVLKGEMQWP